MNVNNVQHLLIVDKPYFNLKLSTYIYISKKWIRLFLQLVTEFPALR